MSLNSLSFVFFLPLVVVIYSMFAPQGISFFVLHTMESTRLQTNILGSLVCFRGMDRGLEDSNIANNLRNFLE
ncbi:MAG: hypothetical protein E7291_08280 [Lachnospiraceae bacterium]|nr:hypothetical protein [Lachnospiraceae bacterium]